MADDPTETELKFEILPGKVAALRSRRIERLGGGSGDARHLVSTYFDTPDERLRKAGLTLRVRQAGGQRIQTVKAGAGFLLSRPEWEAEIASDEPDLAAAAETPVGDVLGPEAGPLRPVFATEIDRTTWTVERDGSAIEIALDEGRIVAGTASRPVCELELELKAGDPAALFALARELGGADSLRVGSATKAEAGYRLVAGQDGKAAKAEPIALDAAMNAAAAFPAIVRSCLRQLGRNEALVSTERSADALHQARVAIRRLRSAVSLFGDLVVDSELPRVKSRLKRLSDRLGAARNLDVFLARLDPADPAGERRRMELSVARETAYARVAATFAGKRHRALVLDLLAWSEAGAWRRTEEPALRERLDGPVGDEAAAILKRARRRVRRKGRSLAEQPPEARHRVRIAAKKLRYASEFFSALVEGMGAKKRHGRFLARLETLQEILGDLNDIETGRNLADPMLPPPDPAHEAKLAVDAGKAWRKLRKAKPFWTKFD